jgi:hypothetical protein
MANLSNTSVPNQPRRTSTTKRLIQAAALASALVPLGAVAADAAPIAIDCFTFEGSGAGCSGSGDFSSGNEGDYIWKFFDGNSDELLYTFQVMGTAANDFTLDVTDEWVGVDSENYFIDFPDSECIPLLDDQETCVIFNASADEDIVWDGLYYIEIRWIADPLTDPGDAPNKPPDDGRNHIFRSPEGTNTFTDVLATELYDPELQADPDDPALGGRGSNFSSFIAGRASVPEPSTLLLLGTGVAAALYRRRKIG